MKDFRAFGREQDGSVVVPFAICLAVLLLVTGVAVDYSYAAFQRSTLQRAADAAALAGAKLGSADLKAVEEEAKRFFTGNNAPQVAPIVSVSAETVTVTATYTQPTFIMHAFGQGHVNVGARAVARRGFRPPCVLALDTSEKESIFLNSASKLNMDCGLQTNSSSSEALRLNSGSSIHSGHTCAVGGWTTGGAGAYNPTPKKCPAFPDPLASLPTPSEATAACTKTDYKVDNKAETLTPGVYCKNLLIDNGAVVTLTPGIYVIRECILKISSGSTLKGDDVLLFFTGKDARLQMDNNDSVLEVSGRTSGPYADIVIYQDRTTTTDAFMMNSHGKSRIQGVVYIPNSKLKLNSESGATTAASYFQLIVRQLELNSLGTMVIKNKDYEPKQAGLRERSATLVQ